jgi:hypothetical protein
MSSKVVVVIRTSMSGSAVEGEDADMLRGIEIPSGRTFELKILR